MKRWIPLLMMAGLWAALFTTGRAWGQAACMTGNPAASATCSPGWAYGVSLTTSDLTVLARDLNGTRNCLFLQAAYTNAGNVCFSFETPASAGGPCYELVPGAPYYIYNLPTGNGAPLIPTGPIHAAMKSGTGVLTFQYCR